MKDEKLLVELFNKNYINIVETLSINQPSSLGNREDTAKAKATVDKIILKYGAHPSVQIIW